MLPGWGPSASSGPSLGSRFESWQAEALVNLPVADEWYERTALSDNVTLIVEPHVDKFLQANMWHVRGSAADLLIDCGLGIVPLLPYVIDIFGREPIVVLTHRHLDHVGAAHEFAEVWAHELEPVQAPIAGSLRTHAVVEQLGLPPVPAEAVVPEFLVGAVPDPTFDPDSYRLQPSRVTRTLADGDVIDLGDRSFEIIGLPGHTHGSIGLIEWATSTLYSGDALYDGGLIDELPESSVGAYRGTMNRLIELDIATVHGGHGASFDRPRLRELAENYLVSRAGDPPGDGRLEGSV